MKTGLLPLMLSGVALAQSPGTFTATGSMNVPRVAHTATLLLNGKVLITGGRSQGGAVLASAELYDPGTGTFSPTGDMTGPRSFHTATLLPDGTVLVVGGVDGSSYSTSRSSAEIYDSATGRFRGIERMAIPDGLSGEVACHAATLLSNGKVLVAVGTWWPGPAALGIFAQLYNPADGTFAATGVSVTAHSYEYTCPLSTLLLDGRVLVMWEDPDAELYHPDSGSFGPAGYMTIREGRQYYTSTLLTSGAVLVAGGLENGILRSAELYDPAAGTFRSTGELNNPRSSHTATLLPDGSVLIAGGYADYEEHILAEAELYDPTTGVFAATGEMSAPRSGHTATLLPDGTVLLTGGGAFIPQVTAVRSAELYHPANLVPAPARRRGRR